MNSLSRIKVKSTTYVYPTINMIPDHEILLTGELGVMYGIRFVTSKPTAPQIGDMFMQADSGMMIVYDGKKWQTMESAKSEISDFKVMCDSKPQTLSYLNGIRTRSKNYPKPLRGHTKSIWHLDEWTFTDTAESLTAQKLQALGISPKFLSPESSYSSASASASDAYAEFMENTQALQKAVSDVLMEEMEKLLMTEPGQRVTPALGSTLTTYLSGVLH